MLGIYDIQVLEFDFFYNVPDGVERKTDDGRVAPTISGLLRDVFANPLTVIVYVCDASDGKQRGRQKLFELWHKSHMADAVDRYPFELDFEVVDGEVAQVLACALLRQDFPHVGVLQKELLNEAAGIISDKYFQ